MPWQQSASPTRTLTCTSHTLAVMLDVTSTPPGMASSAAPVSGPRVTPAALSAAAFAFSLASDSSSSLFCGHRDDSIGNPGPGWGSTEQRQAWAKEALPKSLCSLRCRHAD